MPRSFPPEFEGGNMALTQQSQVRFLFSLVLLPWALSLAACATPQVQPYETLDAGSLRTTVQGQVTLMGTMIPDVQYNKIYRDSKLCGEEVIGEELNVLEGSRGIEGVIVSLEGITKGKPKPKEEVIVIENRGCRFIPYITTTIVGSTLQVQNTDPILHTTHARFESKHGRTLWNVVQQGGAQGIMKLLTMAGVVDVRCDLHPNMRSYVHVFNHPYFTVTDTDGIYEITNVPAGTYQLTVWHARIGSKGRTVMVPQKGTVTADIGMQFMR
jgi:plastocyanin